MVTIAQNNDVVTVIVSFSVEPTKQEELVKGIIHILETVVNKYPGFVSSSIHKSQDGTRVVNYIQWKTREDYEGYIKNFPAHAFATNILNGPPDMHAYEIEYQSSVYAS